MAVVADAGREGRSVPTQGTGGLGINTAGDITEPTSMPAV